MGAVERTARRGGAWELLPIEAGRPGGAEVLARAWAHRKTSGMGMDVGIPRGGPTCAKPACETRDGRRHPEADFTPSPRPSIAWCVALAFAFLGRELTARLGVGGG